MRLFIAINFDNSVKDVLMEIVQEMRNKGARGSYSLRENLHLTLVFIGETDRVSDVKAAMNRVSYLPFSFTIGRLGKFKRAEGDILWTALSAGPELFTLQAALQRELLMRDFSIDTRPFKPHLTLGRKVILPKGFALADCGVKEQSAAVNRISLMKSERINGKLTYTEIHHI